MNDTGIPMLVYEYTLTGQRNVGQQRKRGTDVTSLDAFYPVATDDYYFLVLYFS
jgi:hypothetical protein